MNALEWVDGQVWLITPSGLDAVRALAGRDGDALAKLVAANPGKKFDGSKAMTVRDGVATIPVHGTISRYSTVLQDYCGGTSTEAVAKDVAAALADPSVKAILYDFDTPGGAASGVLELAEMIRAGAGKKPSAACASGLCCSAGYWLASAAGEVSVSPTAVVGSIGAVCQVDTKEKKDVETYRSRQSPMKHVAATSAEFRESTQSTLDGLAAEFIAGVAANRGTTPAKVEARYGKGGTMLGRDAVKAGMADRIGSYESTHARLAAGKVKVRPKPAPAAAAKPKGTASMSLRTFFASLVANSPDAVEAALVEAGDTAEFVAPAKAGTLLVAQPAFDADAERAKIRAEVEAAVLKDAKESARAGLSEAFTANALAFVEAVADRTAPAESEALSALYVDAAMADRENPLPHSRLAFLVAGVEARPKHNRGESVVPAEDSVAAAKVAGFKVLATAGADADEAARRLASDRRMVEMYQTSPSGRAYLKSPEGLALVAGIDTASAE